MKGICLSTLLLTIALTSNGQINWPEITQTSKPWTRWWWEGSAVDKEGLAAAMKKYKEAGLGGLEITPIYGVHGAEDKFINFLSPKWIEMLSFSLQNGKKLGLGIDMATGTGWPFGGPWVTPEDACKDINVKEYTLKGGAQLKEKIEFIQEPLVRTVGGRKVDIDSLSYPIATNENLQKYAFDQVKFRKDLPLVTLMAYGANGQVLDLTIKVKDKQLNWTAPEQTTWTLYALFLGWHGKMVERAAPGGEGDAIDHFSDKALKNYLSKFDQAFSGKDITGLRSFFNDSYEVDDAKGEADWTPDFLSEFVKRRGYDLKGELPALFQKDKDKDKNARVLYDYRQTVSELLLEKFTIPWHSWAKAKGKLVRNQSHGSPANILDLYDAIDIPETEGENELRLKFATSTAHVSGKPLASSESATWLNDHFLSTLGDAKQAIDKYFTGGVNHIFYHGTNYSPQNEPWPGWLFYAAVHFTPANPFWKDFGTLNKYIAHTQSFLQQGKPDNDILFYFPFSDRQMEVEDKKGMLHHFDGMEGFEHTSFEAAGEKLLEKGYAFDLISDKQVGRLTVAQNKLQTGGVAYQTVLLADTKYLPLETMEKLVALANNGATILIYKNLPADVPGWANLTEQRKAYKKLVDQLTFSGKQIKTATIGKGAFLMGDDLEALLQEGKIRRERMTDKGLHFVRRTMDDGSCYFVVNRSKENFTGYAPLGVNATAAALYDPMMEKAGIAKMKTDSSGGLSVYLDLQPGESCIIRTSDKQLTGNLYPYIQKNGTTIALTGTWKISFLNGGPTLPASGTQTEPDYWTTLPGEDVQKFSGTAAYTISFAKPTGTATAWLLNLNKVANSAEIVLNGKSIGTLIGPAYQLVIPSAKLLASNTMEVRVTNGMANRIIDLDKQGVQWKKFYNINFPAKTAENRGADGLFTTKGWTPLPSGLKGPVTLTPLK